MLRVDKEALTKIKGLYYFNDKLFSGLAFDNSDPNSINAYIVDCGVKTNPYHGHPNFEVSSGVGVHFDNLEPELEHDVDSPYLYRGEPYDGIAYKFKGKYCIEEVLYNRGWPVGNFEYFNNGHIFYGEATNGEIHQIVNYFEEGALKAVSILVRGISTFEATYTEEGKLNSLVTGAELLIKYLINNSNVLLFPLLCIINENSNLKASLPGEDVFLSGEAVNDELFNQLFPFEVREQLVRLRCSNTMLSQDLISSLRSQGVEVLKYR